MSQASDLKRIANAAGRLELMGAPEGFDALVMADIVKARGGLTCFVARDTARASAFADGLKFFAEGVEQVRLPSWDCLPYDRIGPSPAVAAERMATLSRLALQPKPDKPTVLIATAPALLQRVPTRAVVKASSYLARTGNDVNIADLERYFAVNGYIRASTVAERGEFAIRGGVIDVWAPGAEEPVRLDLFGDTLESIRAFDPETQRSTRQLKSIDLLPVSEVLMDAEAIARFRRGFVQKFGAPGDDPVYAAVSEGARRAGVEHWLPLFYDQLETVFDYLGEDALVALDHLAVEARDERLAMVNDAYETRLETQKAKGGGGYHALEPAALYLPAEEWDQRLAGRPSRRFSPFQVPETHAVIDMGAKIGRIFAAERAQDSVNLFEAAGGHAKALAASGKRVLFAPGRRARPSAWGPCWPTTG